MRQPIVESKRQATADDVRFGQRDQRRVHVKMCALDPGARRPMALAGIAWGVAVLVRPTSLLAPPFVLLVLRGWLRQPLRRVLASTLVFAATWVFVVVRLRDEVRASAQSGGAALTS